MKNPKSLLTWLVLIILVVVGGWAYFEYAVNDSENSDNQLTDENSVSTSSDNKNNNKSNIEVNELVTLKFGESNLEPIQGSYYEGFVYVDGSPRSFVKFNMDEVGSIIDINNGRKLARVVLEEMKEEDIERVVISIEPEGDTDPNPSPIIVAEGTSMGRLQFKAVDLSSTSGEYILGTPSNDPEGLETAGLWFVKPGVITASLNLPDITSTNWRYEGWAVYNDQALSSGRFGRADGPDDFSDYNASPRFPALPGEDYLINLPEGVAQPVNLANGSSKVVVTLEPYVDGVDYTGTGPFQIKFLSADIGEGIPDHVLYGLNQDLSSVPFIDIDIN